MAKKKTGISEELREAIHEHGRAGGSEAYKDQAAGQGSHMQARDRPMMTTKDAAS